MKYYKITNEEECHNGFQYKDGLNVDRVPFNPTASGLGGGIYFASNDILAFLYQGVYIREVTLPKNAKVYEDPLLPQKWKADKVILGPKRLITADVVEELIAEGANIHADRESALRTASRRGNHEIVEVLLKHGADVHVLHDDPIRSAAKEGHTQTVKILIKRGANVKAWDDAALASAAHNGNLDMIKLLLKHGANIFSLTKGWGTITAHPNVQSFLKEQLKNHPQYLEPPPKFRAPKTTTTTN